MTGEERESILYAYAVEPIHDQDTFHRYLEKYPALSEDLIDLAVEIRLARFVPPRRGEMIDDPKADAAWQQFLNAKSLSADQKEEKS